MSSAGCICFSLVEQLLVWLEQEWLPGREAVRL